MSWRPFSASVGTGGEVDASAPGRSRSRWLRRRAATVGLVVTVVVVVLIAVSVVGAARTPGNESFRAKWADWLRDHRAGALVTPLENWYFGRQEPPKGGRPSGLHVLPASPGTADAGRSDHLARPADVPLVVQPG